jgi:hypothetical protein
MGPKRSNQEGVKSTQHVQYIQSTLNLFTKFEAFSRNKTAQKSKLSEEKWHAKHGHREICFYNILFRVHKNAAYPLIKREKKFLHK